MTLMRELIAEWGLLGLADHVVEHAIDAVADDELLLERLDVDVGGLFLHGPEEQRIDELDHRGVVFGRLQDVHRTFEVHRLFEFAFDRVDQARSIALVDPVDRVLDPHARRNDRPDVAAGEGAQIIQRRFVERVAHGKDERRSARTFIEGKRDHFLGFCVVDRDARHELRVDLVRPEVLDVGHAELLAERAEDFVRQDHVPPHEDFTEQYASPTLKGERLLELRLGERGVLEKEFAEPGGLARKDASVEGVR